MTGNLGLVLQRPLHLKFDLLGLRAALVLDINRRGRRNGDPLPSHLNSKAIAVFEAVRQTTNLRVDWFVNPRLFRFALADFERNDNQQLNYRNAVGGGIGRTLIKSRTSELSALAGVTATVERFRFEETSEESHKVWGGEGLVGLEWESQLLPWLRVNTELSVHPDLISGGDYRINYDTTLRIPLFKRLSWSLNFFDRFDSKAPEEVDRNDYGLISAFGLEF